jgi:hypothetical protein
MGDKRRPAFAPYHARVAPLGGHAAREARWCTRADAGVEAYEPVYARAALGDRVSLEAVVYYGR